MYQIKVFEEDHEEDLEEAVNDFFRETNPMTVDIQYRTAMCQDDDDGVICSFSALILYQV